MTDDELVEMMRQARDTVTVTRNPAETDRMRMAAILTRIAPHLEARALEMAARECERQERDFLDPAYATQQPLSSFNERFACRKCAKAVRVLAARASGTAEAGEEDIRIEGLVS